MFILQLNEDNERCNNTSVKISLLINIGVFQKILLQNKLNLFSILFYLLQDRSLVFRYLFFKPFALVVASRVKILNIYIMLSCTHLYHFFSVSIHCLQCIHCFLHQTLEIFNRQLLKVI